MKHKGGRPLKFTESVLEDIISGIEHGFTLKAACRFAGISYSTLACWMFRGKQAKKSGVTNRYVDVFERIDHATYAEKIKRRDELLSTLTPRDFRFGWKNPMPLQARKKISDSWRKSTA